MNYYNAQKFYVNVYNLCRVELFCTLMLLMDRNRSDVKLFLYADDCESEWKIILYVDVINRQELMYEIDVLRYVLSNKM